MQAFLSKNINSNAVYRPIHHNVVTRFTSDNDDLLIRIPNMKTPSFLEIKLSFYYRLLTVSEHSLK